MEPTLFSFIWKYSKRQQVMLLALTLITFPFLYATLELPKRIINDAISAETDTIPMFGVEIAQIHFLLILCFGYLAAVLVHGLLKMRLNTSKGVLAERMLRRFRYQLIRRMTLFPKTYFRETSQGELVSMITAEAEPMGGLMGDAVAQPVFQAGQMLIIVVFLFLQSVWFGLAGIALIPLQAWLIPMLQRQINQLNKKRVIQVRALSAEIGETAAGMTDLRQNGGLRYRLAQFTDRLGRLFGIRFEIYQKKFFMKFLNNFITQLTPFFFYLVGGYLAIRGDITVGALVAALAAYKDLSSPWKELLTYYNQVQDMSLRWDIVTERFAPADMFDPALIDGEPGEIPHLNGDLVLQDVTVQTTDGTPILEDISMTLPAGSEVAICVPNQSERNALADLLTREVLPARGTVTLAGHNLSGLHQAVIAGRIGYAAAEPYLFNGKLGENVMMSLRTSPKTVLWDPNGEATDEIEARRAGNSPDSLKADWTDPALAGFTNESEVRHWWYQVIQALGVDETVCRAVLRREISAADHPDLTTRIVALREEVTAEITARGLEDVVFRFDPDTFNPAIPLGDNLFFAAARVELDENDLSLNHRLVSLVMQEGLGEQSIAIAQTVIESLNRTFGTDGTDHPLFQALGIDPELYEQVVDIARRRREKGDGAITEDEFTIFLAVPFILSAEQLGAALPDSFREDIVALRKEKGAALRAETSDLFVEITPDRYFDQLTVAENLLYGAISRQAGARDEMVFDVLMEVLRRHDLDQGIAETIWNVELGIGGANLPTVIRQRIAYGRASLKRPDVLILDRALANDAEDARARTRYRLRELLPDATLIYLENRFNNPASYDMHIDIRDGRIEGQVQAELPETLDNDTLQKKITLIARTELFANLSPRNQRLLAFSADWFKVKAGQTVFKADDPADAVYLCVKGHATLSWIAPETGELTVISDVMPGRLIGDMSVIRNEARQLDLIAVEKTSFLRIGAREFMSVVENDSEVAMSLLRTVSGYLSETAELIRDSGLDISDEMRARSKPDAP